MNLTHIAAHLAATVVPAAAGRLHLLHGDAVEHPLAGYDTALGVKVLIANAGDAYYGYQGMCPHQDVCLDEGFFDGATLT